MTRNLSAILVGAGKIGVRHLQGLARSKELRRICVVDTDVNIAEKVMPFWQDTPDHKNIEIEFAAIECLENYECADFALVSTPAFGRLEILRKLIDYKIQNILIEKVAFQSISDYEATISVCQRTNTRVFCNLPYRMVPLFQKFKQIIANQPFSMTVESSAKGLGCNGIHFFDLFEFVGGTSVAEIVCQKKGKLITTSRGPQYKDFNGIAFCSSQNSSTCELNFDEGNPPLPIIKFKWGHDYLIADYNNLTVHSSIDDLSHADLFMPQASEIAHIQMNEILLNITPLPTIQPGLSINRLMLKSYHQIFELTSSDDAVCPIT